MGHRIYKSISVLLIFALQNQQITYAQFCNLRSVASKNSAKGITLASMPSVPSFSNLGELLEPHFELPSTGKVIDATVASPQSYLKHYPASSRTFNRDTAAKFKRDCNLNWAVSTAPRRNTLLILCAGSTDYHTISNIEGIERIILADLDGSALVSAWQNMPSELKDITYLLRVDASWLSPGAAEKTISVIRESETLKEAKEKVLDLLADDSLWEPDPRYRFPDGYADIIIMEKSYPQITLSLRDFIISSIEKRFRLRFEDRLSQDSEFHDGLYELIQKRLHPIIVSEMSRLANPEGGSIYVSAEEYQHCGHFNPVRKIIDENDPVYSVRNTTDISRFLPVQTWIDVASKFYYAAYGWRGLCYAKGDRVYPLMRCERLGSRAQAIIDGLANPAIVYGRVEKIDDWRHDCKLITPAGEKRGNSLAGYLRERSGESWLYNQFLGVVLKVCINLCGTLEILHKNGIVYQSLDEDFIFFPENEETPILVVGEDSLRFDPGEKAEQREALFLAISQIGHLIRNSFRHKLEAGGRSSYEFATGGRAFALGEEETEALEVLICSATMHSRNSYTSFHDFALALVNFCRKHLYLEDLEEVMESLNRASILPPVHKVAAAKAPAVGTVQIGKAVGISPAVKEYVERFRPMPESEKEIWNPKGMYTKFTLEAMERLKAIFLDSEVLDIGTASTVLARVSLELFGASHAVATEKKPDYPFNRVEQYAPELTPGVANKLEILTGNLFDPVQGRKFDIVLFNADSTETGRAYIRGLKSALRHPDGIALLMCSTAAKDEFSLIAAEAGLAIEPILKDLRTDFGKSWYIYAIAHTPERLEYIRKLASKPSSAGNIVGAFDKSKLWQSLRDFRPEDTTSQVFRDAFALAFTNLSDEELYGELEIIKPKIDEECPDSALAILIGLLMEGYREAGNFSTGRIKAGEILISFYAERIHVMASMTDAVAVGEKHKTLTAIAFAA